MLGLEPQGEGDVGLCRPRDCSPPGGSRFCIERDPLTTGDARGLQATTPLTSASCPLPEQSAMVPDLREIAAQNHHAPTAVVQGRVRLPRKQRRCTIYYALCVPPHPTFLQYFKSPDIHVRTRSGFPLVAVASVSQSTVGTCRLLVLHIQGHRCAKAIRHGTTLRVSRVFVTTAEPSRFARLTVLLAGRWVHQEK